MKRKIAFCFFILLCIRSQSQNGIFNRASLERESIKKELPSLVTTYLSGAFEGTAEILKWHYDRFENRFPNANKSYWNPKYSGDNKYRGGLGSNGPKYFGSTTFLVWTTDGYHATRFARNNMFLFTLILHPNHNKHWKRIVFDALMHAAAFQIGFHTTYGVIFK